MVFGIGTENDVLGYVAEHQVGFSEGQLRTVRFIELVGPSDDVVPVDRRVDSRAINAFCQPMLGQVEVTKAGTYLISILQLKSCAKWMHFFVYWLSCPVLGKN